jgi:FlaA1/EpsC-like NDP-sugar epimerase
VDIVEENPIFAAKNNILGTWNVLQASLKFNVKNFVFISTDKAVNPINIMGMTKKCGEVLTGYFSSLVHKNQNFCSVRFGNVIGSSGSFVQVLKEQVASGGPITITDKRASRYFMTISDAVHLVIQAISLRDNGNTFVLKMDEPVNIYEMVKKFLSENNLKILDKNNPSGDIQIKFIGLRQGEKLHEELFQNNNISQTSNNLILVEKNRYKLTDKNLIKFKKDLLESIRLEDTLMLERTLHILLDNANSK